MSAGRAERRLAAILAADIAGYSRLMGADEEGTLARLRTLRRELIDPKITEHRGRIVKTTGDGILVEFASVVDAVCSAVEIQKVMAEWNAQVSADQRIDFRVGINLGDILIEEGDIFGDGVNVAARLEALAEPGGICVSKVVRDQVRDKLDITMDDLGEREVKNITRPIHLFAIRPTGQRSGASADESRVLALPDKPSLAVLPFQNMTGEAEQEYFVDGIVEEITTAIARLPWLFVIARNSAFIYKGKPVNVKQVARELGVRYVLEGSVRKGGNLVRITGQLIDTTTGAHICTDRFDGVLDDIFDLQDQVASKVAGAIEPRLKWSEMERASRKPTDSLGAYDLYLRGLAQFYRFTEESLAEAVVLIQRALSIDPNYVPAAALVGWCRVVQQFQGWAVSNAEMAEGVRLARKALERARDDPETMVRSAYTLFHLAGETTTALAFIDRALTLNPNAAIAWLAKGWVQAQRNEPESSIDAFRHAFRLSPYDPLGYLTAAGMAMAHNAARRFEEAIEWAERALRDQPRFLPSMRAKVVANAHLGRLDEARADLSRILSLYPGSTVGQYRASAFSIAPALVDLYVAALRLAGLPEA